MAKINILDSSVFNRIAAGEVVDRPYSVVKEFVENSIDAGATSISIEIERGGKDRICVSDNGSGIEREDFTSAFFAARDQQDCARGRSRRHYDAGFSRRGSREYRISGERDRQIRAAGGDCAYQISCSGGKMGEILPCARDVGTEICAENLFFNTPVRAKFLKSDKGKKRRLPISFPVLFWEILKFPFATLWTENCACNRLAEDLKRLSPPCTGRAYLENVTK